MMIAAASVPPQSLGRLYMRLTRCAMDSLTREVDRAYPLAMISMYLGGLGEWVGAQECLSQAEAIFERFGNMRRLEDSLTIRFYNLQHQGSLVEARKTVEQLLQSTRLRGDPQTTGWAKLLHAQSALPVEGGEAGIQALGADVDSSSDTLTRFAYPAIKAACYFETGDLNRAKNTADQALQVLGGSPPVAFSLSLSVAYLAGVYTSLIEDAMRRGVGIEPGLERNRRYMMKVLNRFARVFPVGRPQAVLWNAVNAVLDGNKKAAERLWQRALLEAKSLGMLHDRGLILYHRGRLTGGAAGQAMLEEALVVFTQTGAAYDCSQALAILKSGNSSA